MKLVFKIVLLMTLLGVLAGCDAFFALHNPPEPWEYVAQAPKTPTQLFYDGLIIYVKSADDFTYSCPTNDKLCEAVESFGPLENTSDTCGEAAEAAPSAPGKVVATVVFRDCADDGYTDTHIIALDDATIWKRVSFHGY